MRLDSRTNVTAYCALALLALVSGCGYMVGAPYAPDVQTVHVPIFTSTSFRRGIEFQLTEAVQNEIQQRSHFRIAKEAYADTRLTGHIVRYDKQVLGESAFDDPRELQFSLAVQVTWEDLRTGRILREQRVPIPPDLVHLLATSSFAPEIGQSRATATHEAVQKMARQIVQMMEYPW